MQNSSAGIFGSTAVPILPYEESNEVQKSGLCKVEQNHKKLKNYLGNTTFYGSDPILLFYLLSIMVEQCNTMSLSEDEAVYDFPNFL